MCVCARVHIWKKWYHFMCMYICMYNKLSQAGLLWPSGIEIKDLSKYIPLLIAFAQLKWTSYQPCNTRITGLYVDAMQGTEQVASPPSEEEYKATSAHAPLVCCVRGPGSSKILTAPSLNQPHPCWSMQGLHRLLLKSSGAVEAPQKLEMDLKYWVVHTGGDIRDH